MANRFRFGRYGVPPRIRERSSTAYVVWTQFWTTRLGEVYRSKGHTKLWYAVYDGVNIAGPAQSRQYAATQLADEHRRRWGPDSIE